MFEIKRIPLDKPIMKPRIDDLEITLERANDRVDGVHHLLNSHGEGIASVASDRRFIQPRESEKERVDLNLTTVGCKSI